MPQAAGQQGHTAGCACRRHNQSSHCLPLNRCRCPKNTLARKVLGGLKDRAEPVDLPVYPVRVQGGKVFVRFI